MNNQCLQKFDLIVIGGGSGLDIATAAAFHNGLKVAIIEKDRLGGTCLNRGCIPSKLLIHSADVIETIKRANLFGINVKGFSIDFKKIISRVNEITDSESDDIKKNLMEVDNPKLFSKECKFIGEKKIALRNKKEKRDYNDYDDDNIDDIITAEKILIATGTKPNIPKIKGLENSGFMTSDEALRLQEQPDTITFIGGGYITCELAHFFGSLGTEINIIQRNNLLIPSEDKDLAEKLTSIFNNKFNIYLNFNPELVSKFKDNNKKTEMFNVVAKNIDNGEIIKINSDQLIVATGRIPNTSSLDLENTKVKVNYNGFIVVDENLETTMPGIFALGDVVGRYQFKHNANLEAKYAYRNILQYDKKQQVNYTAMPHAIFSFPQIAGVGFTESELKEKSIKYNKSIYPYNKTGMGHAIEDNDGFVKFLVDMNNRKILGCHIIGTDASTLIHEVLVIMRSGDGTIDSIVNTVHIHPALSEVVARAASRI
jgi:dihydrolipoamide dehydrogenase